MNKVEIVVLVYVGGIVLVYLSYAIAIHRRDVKLKHVLMGPFNGDDGDETRCLFCGMFIWPILAVIFSYMGISESKAAPTFKMVLLPVWKVIRFPWDVLVWILNIRLWPFKLKKCGQRVEGVNKNWVKEKKQ